MNKEYKYDEKEDGFEKYIRVDFPSFSIDAHTSFKKQHANDSYILKRAEDRLLSEFFVKFLYEVSNWDDISEEDKETTISRFGIFLDDNGRKELTQAIVDHVKKKIEGGENKPDGNMTIWTQRIPGGSVEKLHE